MLTVNTEAKMAFTVAEACAATGIGKTSLYSLFKEGKLTPVKVCGRTLVLAERLYAGLDAIELRIRQTPAESHFDVAVKIAMWFETGQPIGWEMAEQGDWQTLMLLSAYKDAKRLGGAA